MKIKSLWKIENYMICINKPLPKKWYKEIFNEAKKNELICFSSHLTLMLWIF